MDYNSLTTQIQSYANRTDAFFISQIPYFIDQAVNRIYSEAKNIGFEKIQLNAPQLTINMPTSPKPADWRETVSIQYIIPGTPPSVVYLLPRTYEFCQNYWPNTTLTGLPQFYADLDYNRFYFAPTPNANYNGQLIYLSTPLFNADNPTNFLTMRYPSLLLYASMLETASYLKDDERIPVFETMYNRALQNINRDTKERYIDRTAKRDVA